MAVKFIRFDRWGKQIGTLTGIESAEWTEELNGSDELELKLTDALEKGDRVVWCDSWGEWHEHVVLEVVEEHDADRAIRTVLCENSISELYGDIILDKRPNNATCANALKAVLEDEGNRSNVTRWQVGNVNIEGRHNASFYRESCRECVKTILDTWGGELSTTIEVGATGVTARKVNITRRGTDKGKRFAYGFNASSISRTFSTADVVTALYVFGKGEQTESGGYGRRITIESVGNIAENENGTFHISGDMYLQNTKARDVWGRPDAKGAKCHVFATYTFSECEDPVELAQLGIQQLDTLIEPEVSYEADVIDFREYGYDFAGSQLGDTVAVIDSVEGFEVRAKARVTKTKRDLLDDSALTSLTISNFKTSNFGDMWYQTAGSIGDLNDRSDYWDNSAFTTDSYMQQLMNRFNEKYEQGGVYKYESFEHGTIYSSVPLDENMRPTSTTANAFQLKGGGWRISNTVDSNGDFVWSTMADGSGIIADYITSGTLQAGIIRDKTGKNYWNLDTGDLQMVAIPDGMDSAISGVDVEYAIGDSSTEAPVEGWGTSAPTWQADKYVWQRTKSTDINGVVTYSDPVCIQGAKGEDGKDGLPGKDGEDGKSVSILGSYDTYAEFIAAHPTGNEGDGYMVAGDLYTWTGDTWTNVGKIQGPAGVSAYVHFAYSTSADGKEGFSLVPFDGATYMGVYSDSDQADSADYTKYTWTRFLGLQGPAGKDGVDGVNGRDGTNGTSSYVHIKYSPVPNPTDSQMTETPDTYIGICTNTTQPDPTTASSYTWSKLEGHDGEDGLPGTNGVDGKTTYVHFAYATSSDGSQGFSLVAFEGAEYIGVRTDYVQADSTNYRDYVWSKFKGQDGTDGINGKDGTNGKDGVSSYVHIKYSPVANPTNSQMTETPSAYIGICTDSNIADPTTASSYTWSKWEGKDGTNGIPGTNGADGKTTYVHFAYATSSNGSQGFSLTPFDGAVYVGVRTDYVQADSTNYQDYEWSKMKGDDGTSVKSATVNATWTQTTADGFAEGSVVALYKTWFEDASIYESLIAGDSVALLIKNSTSGKSWAFLAEVVSPSTNFTTFRGKGYLSGADGLGVKAIQEQYYLSTSATTATGGSWSNIPQVWKSGYYYWTRSQITWEDNTITYTTAVLARGLNSANQNAADAKDEVDKLDQQEIFNRLTNNGETQGIYLENGKVYINGEYIKAGTVSADKLADSSGINYLVVGAHKLSSVMAAIGISFYNNEDLMFSIYGGKYSSGSTVGDYPVNISLASPINGSEFMGNVLTVNYSSISISNSPYVQNYKAEVPSTTYAIRAISYNPNGLSITLGNNVYYVYRTPGNAETKTMTLGSGFWCAKNGSTVSMGTDSQVSVSIPGGWVKRTIGTVPAGWRPYQNMQFPVCAGSTSTSIYIEVNASTGQIAFVNPTDSAIEGGFIASATWAACN